MPNQKWAAAEEVFSTVPEVIPQLGKKGYSLAPTGQLWRKFGLLLLLVALFLAAWFDQTMIVMLTGLPLTAAILAWLWSRYSLSGVSCQRSLSERRVFPDEYIELKLHLANRKPLPLPWIRLDDKVPPRLMARKVIRTYYGQLLDGFLTNTTSLLWYREKSWQYRIHCTKRGYYPLGPLVVSSGDIFGFYPRSQTLPETEHIIVYPRLYPLGKLILPSLYPVGDTRAERRIFMDPSRPIGVRDYAPGDSLRHVHWKASARHQNLQVKVFEPTTTLNVIIFLAVDSFPDAETDKEEEFELGVSTAASIAHHLVQGRNPVGLFTNSLLPDSGQPVRIQPGRGPTQLISMLEALAKVVPASSGAFTDFFQRERTGLPWGATVVLVVSRPPETLPTILSSLSRAGHKPVVFQIGQPHKMEVERHIRWHHIQSPDDLMEMNHKEAA